MKFFHKILGGMLTAVMLTSAATAAPILSVSAATASSTSVAAATSGTTGDCKWNFNTKTGAMTISGKGRMADYKDQYDVPWDPYVYDVKSIVIESGVTYVGECSFVGYNHLSLTIADTVTEIGDDAFAYSLSVTNLKLSANLKKIGRCAFNGLGVESLTLPKNLKEVGGWSFYGCENLKTLTIPDGCTCDFSDDFENCTALTTVSIGDSATVGERAFAYCPVSEYKVSAKNKTLTAVSGHLFSKDKTTLLFYANGKTNTQSTMSDYITDIGDYAFTGNKNLTTVTFPKNLKSVGKRSFFESNITNITFPNTLVSIGAEAFLYTPWYKNQPDGLVYAGKVAYKYKNATPAAAVSLRSDTVGIADGLFKNASDLVKITLPGTLLHIGNDAFYNCRKLKSASLPNNLVTIGNRAFYNCQSLEKIFMTDTVTDFGEECFRNCSALKSLVLSKNLTEIPRWSFAYCDALTEVEIPEKVTKIGANAFSYANNLKTFTFYNRNLELENKALDSGSTTHTIRGYRGSTAETYAKEYKYIFEPLDSVYYGDVNGDNTVDAKDRITLTRYLAKWNGYTINKENADVNSDTVVNAKDRIILTRHLAKWKGYEKLPTAK